MKGAISAIKSTEVCRRSNYPRLLAHCPSQSGMEHLYLPPMNQYSAKSQSKTFERSSRIQDQASQIARGWCFYEGYKYGNAEVAK